MACKYTLNGKEYTEKELLHLASTGTALMSVRSRTNNETVEIMKATAGNRFVNLDLFTPYQEATYIGTIGADIIQQIGELRPRMEIKATPKTTFLKTKAKFENSFKVYEYLGSKLDTDAKVKAAKAKPEYLDKFPQLSLVETADDIIEKRDTFKNILDNYEGFKEKVKIYLRKFGLTVKEDSDKFEELKFDEEYYKTLINENEDPDSFTEDERFIRESFEDGSNFLQNPRDTASARVKQFFAIVPSGKINNLGLREYVSYDEIIENFLQIGSELETVNYENLQKALLERAKGKPFLKNVSAMLGELAANKKVQLLNEILTFTNKAFQEQILVKWTKTGVGVDIKIMKSNRNNVIFQIYEDWLEGQKSSKIITSKNGQLIVDSAVAKDLKDSLIKVKSQSVENKKAWVKKFMSTIGINYTDDMINALEVKSNAGVFRKGNMNSNFAQLFEDNNLFSLIVNKYNTPPTGKVEVGYEEANNALKDEHTSFNTLAEIFYEFTPGRYYTSSSRNGENKSIYAYIEPSYLERVKKKIKYSNDYIGKVLKKTFAKSSLALKSLKKSIDEGKKNFVFEFDYADSIKEDSKGKDGVVRKYQSPKEQMIDAIWKHQNGGNRSGLYNMFTLSNKTTTPVITITKYKLNDAAERRSSKDIKFLKYNGGSVRNYFQFEDAFKNQLYNLAESEISRIVEYSRQLKANNNLNIKNFDSAFQLFYLFPILNKSSIDENGERMESIRNKMYQGEYPSKDDVEHIKDELAEMFKNRVIGSLSKNVKDGIIVKTKLPNGQIELSFPNFDNAYMAQQEINGLPSLYKAIYAIADFEFNYMRAQITTLQLFGADPALFYKQPKSIKKNVDITTLPIDKKMAIVQTTLDEFSKRAAMFIAPGGQGVWTWFDSKGRAVDRSNYKALTVEDINLKMELFNNSSFESTDAQEFITLQEYIDRLMSMGRIPEEIWQSITDKVEAKPGNYQLTDAEKNFIYQPTKPVYTNATDISGDFTRIDYVKSSAYPLIPEIISGTPLDDLRKLMETNNIRSANFASAKKTGQPIKPVKLFDEEGNFIGAPIADVKSAIQTLGREGLHNQQEVPPQKDEISNISQMNRSLFDGLLEVKDFVLEGEEFNGREFKNLKENIRIALFQKAEDEMLVRMGVERVGNTVKLVNKRAFQKLLAEEALERGFSLNEINAIKVDDNGDLMIPLYLMPKSEKFEGLINSLISKIVQQKNPGTSLIQVTGTVSKMKMGELSKDEKNDIIWLPNYDAKKGLQYMRKGADKVDRKGNIVKGATKPAQVLVSQYIRDEEGNLIDLKKFLKKDKNGKTTNILDTSMFSEEMFQLVASRIPNQSHPSTLPIEVVGFLPSYMENTIIVPDGITKQMGSDFDVDKLYAYLSAFRFRYSAKTEAKIKEIEKKKFDVKQENEQANTELFKKLQTSEEKAQIKKLKDTKTKIVEKMKWNISGKEKAKKQKSIDNLNAIIGTIYENIKSRNAEEYLKLKRKQEINNAKLATELAKLDKEIAEAKSDGIVGVNKVEYNISDYDGTASSLSEMTEDQLHQIYRDLHWSVLTNPAAFEKIAKSIDYGDIDAEEKVLEDLGLLKTNLDYAPMGIGEQIQVFIDNKSGAVGTGVFANLGSFLADNQDKNIYLGSVKDNVEVKNPILVKDDKGNVLALYKITEDGSTVIEKEVDGKTVIEKRFKGDNNSMLLSESIDNAKNKKLYKFNWSDENMSALSAIVALSDDENTILNIKFATRFFKQNIIEEYNKELSFLKDSFSEYVEKPEGVAIAKMLVAYSELMSAEYKEKYLQLKEDTENEYQPEIFGAERLLSLLKDGLKVQGYKDVLLDDTAPMEDKQTAQNFLNEYAKAQLDILDLYDKFTTVGKELTKVTSVVYPYAKGIGSTVFDVMDNLRKFKNLRKNGTFVNLDRLAGIIDVDGTKSMPSLSDPKGEIGNAINMSLLLAKSLYEQIYPIHFSVAYQDLVDRVFSALGIEKSSVSSRRYININKDLIKSVRSYLFTSSSLQIADDVEAERKRLLQETPTNKSLATRIKEAIEKYPELSENYFFRNLKTRISTVNGGASQVYYNNPFGDIDELENNKGYLSLIFSGNEELENIAKDLALYTYITGGNQTNSSFGKFIPIEYFISDKDFLKGIKGLSAVFDSQQLDPIMYKQIIQNNPKLATRISDKTFKALTAAKSYEDVEGFTVSINSSFASEFKVEPVDSDNMLKKSKKFADYVSYYDPQGKRMYLYERISSPLSGVYRRINTLGTPKAGFVEYSFDTPDVASILGINMTRKQFKEFSETYLQDEQDSIPEGYQLSEDVDTLSDNFTFSPEYFPSDTDANFSGDIESDTVEDYNKFMSLIGGGIQQPTSETVELSNPANYTNHSGGAPKSDSMWDEMGKRYGVLNHKHYYDGAASRKPPLGNTPLTPEEMEEGIQKVKVVYTQLGRPDKKEYYSLHGRNWFQVKNADAVYAVSDLVAPGETGRKGYLNRTGMTVVEGGTAYAVQMAINEGKPVYVYHQDNTLSDTYKKGWYTYDYNTSQFVKTKTPKLTINFAGVGTSTALTEDGMQAIEDVYKETFKYLADEQETTTSEIYKSLGTKTASENVVILPWATLKNAKSPITKDEVVSTRIVGTDKHFGNPYSNDERVLAANPSLIKTSSTKESVEKYIDWVLNSSEPRAVWIRDRLKSGDLKGKPILYYTELGQPSHATALDYLINKYNWSKPITGSGAETEINIYAGTNENAELSNFAIRPFVLSKNLLDFLSKQGSDYSGVNYKSVEQAFQNIKVSYNNTGFSDTLDKDILSTTDGGKLRQLGKKIDLDVAKWNKDSSYIMKELILESFKQNPDALAKLLATGNATLTHMYQGVEQDKGRFSRLLMEVREELRPKETTIQTIKDGVQVEYTPKGKTRQTYTVVGGKIFNSKGQEVFKEDSKDKNKIFANLAILQNRAVIVEYKGKRYVVNDRDQIMSVQTGDIMKWGPENGDLKSILALANAKRSFSKPEVSEENILESDLVDNNLTTATPLTNEELENLIPEDVLIRMDEASSTEVNIEELDNQSIKQQVEGVQQINDPVASQLIPDLKGINGADVVLKNILKNTKNPFYKTLGPIIDKSFLSSVYIVIDNKSPYPGVYRSNLITINPELAKKDRSNVSAIENLENVIMHELMHAFTADIVRKFETKPASLSPRLRTFADNLNKLFLNTRNKLLQDQNHAPKLFSVMAAVNTKDTIIELDENEKSNYYGLTSLDEFVSMLMTDRGFQQFMNTIVTDVKNNQSVLDKFKSLLRELISVLAKSLGISIKSETVLTNGINNIVGIISEKDIQDFTPTEDETNGDSDEARFNIDDIDNNELEEYDLKTANGIFKANDDQKVAIDTIANFLNSPVGNKLEDNVFLLYGPAGTGKTASLATGIRKALNSTSESPAISYAAISHTAKGELVKAGNKNARTFASLIGARPIIKNGQEVFELLPLEEFTKRDKPMAFPDIFKANWIIIDESSMIGDKEMSAIRQRLRERESEFGNSDVKILFMGDYAQIAPVGVKPDGDGWPIDLMKNKTKSIGLTKIERTKNQDITDFTFRIRRAIDYYNQKLEQNIPSISTDLKYDRIIDAKTAVSTENVKFIKSEDTFVDNFVDIFRKDPFNSNNAVIIGYNNEKHINTISMTDKIRKKIFGSAAQNNMFLPGDPIFLDQTVNVVDLNTGNEVEVSKNSRIIIKNFRAIKKDINIGTKKYPEYITDIPVYEIEGYFGKSLVKVTALDKTFKAQLNNYNEKVKGYILSDGTVFPYYKFMKLKEAGFTDIFHAYIMSGHKVQGQTYNYPFVNESNISSFVRTGPDNNLILTPKDYARILYTGISRAKEKVYILTNRTSDEKGTFVEPVVSKPLMSMGTTQDVFQTEFPKELELENQCKT